MIYLLSAAVFLGGAILSLSSKKSFLFLLQTTPFFLPLYVLRLSAGPLPTTVLEVFLLSVFLGSLRYLDLELIKSTFKRRDIQVVLAFVVLGFLQSFVAPDIISGLGIWRAFFLEPALFYILIRVFFEAEDFKRLRFNLYTTGALLAVIGLIQFATGLGLPAPWDIERRITSIFPYPNALGLFLAPLVGLAALDKDLSGSKKVALVTLFSVGIYLAETEAALVAVITAALVVSFFKFKSKRVIIGALATLTIAAALLVQPIREKVLLQDYSGTVRQSQWSETVQMLSDNWLLGAGTGGYEETFQPYHENQDIEIFAYPHNWVLNAWSDLGLAGVLMFLAIAGLFLIHLPKLVKKSPGASMAMLIILIHGLVDVPFFKNDLAILTLIIVSLMYANQGNHTN